MLESEINGETEITQIMLEDRDISDSNIIRDKWRDNLDYVRRQR